MIVTKTVCRRQNIDIIIDLVITIMVMCIKNNYQNKMQNTPHRSCRLKTVTDCIILGNCICLYLKYLFFCRHLFNINVCVFCLLGKFTDRNLLINVHLTFSLLLIIIPLDISYSVLQLYKLNQEHHALINITESHSYLIIYTV